MLTNGPAAALRHPAAGTYDADIVILALGRPRETQDAIRSALAQTGISRHLWIIDQGSSPAEAAALAEAVAGRTDATLIPLGCNLGVAGGRNLASALGHGRAIAALDNDAAFDTPDTLARAVAALDARPALAAVGLRIMCEGSDRDDDTSWGYPPHLRPRAACVFDTATFVGAGHVIRRDAWRQAGGYDPSLFFTWEEYDFCLRAIDLGWRIEYRGDLVVRHKLSPDHRVAWSEARWFHYVRNRLYIERKWGAHARRLSPRIAAYAAKGLRNGLVVQTLRAIVAAWAMPVAVRRRMSDAGLAYLAHHDAAYRGGVMDRLFEEVFAPLPVQTGRWRKSRGRGAEPLTLPHTSTPAP